MRPRADDWGWTGPATRMTWDYAVRPGEYDISLAIARLRQLGLSHEDAVQGAQRHVYGKVHSRQPGPESEYNRRWAFTPLAESLPVVDVPAPATDVAPVSTPRNPVTPDRWADALAYAETRIAGGSHQDATAAAKTRSLVPPEPVIEAASPAIESPDPVPTPAKVAAVADAVRAMEASPPAYSLTGDRMAMRYGLGVLAMLLGGFGVGVIAQGGNSPPPRPAPEPRPLPLE